MSEQSNLIKSVDNPELELALEFIQNTNRNVFLTGKAGTGKTTFLHNLKRLSLKRMIVVAPTGVAAINAGGVTIHSFFQLPFGPYISTQINDTDNVEYQRKYIHKFSKKKINIIRSLDLLVIDEISMVRADLLDGIDDVLRRYKNKNKPFGGVQLLMIGDIQQLSPVTRDDEWTILKQIYSNMYFFSSRALISTDYISIELKHIYRQSDACFIKLLNKVRENKLDEESLNELNKRYDQTFTQSVPKGYIILTTHNIRAQKINQSKLEQIDSKSSTFRASIEGDFPESAYPTNIELAFKEGSQVMFIKNDISPEKLYYNGKIGIIEKITSDTIYVKCEGDTNPIAVISVEWQNVKYSIDEEKKEIIEDVVGTFSQLPLILAWAITIHKSQGLTFEKAVIDANSSFTHGQVYVALSRCKTLEGMVLSSKITPKSIVNDENVQQFSAQVQSNQPGIEILNKAKHEYQKSIVFEMFNFNSAKKPLYYCLKLYRENSGSIHISFYEIISTILSFIDNKIIEVSEKFGQQITKLIEIEPDVENNQALNERIKKACNYFAEIITTDLTIQLNSISIESDNASILKLINENLNKIRAEFIIKEACLNSCKSGFRIKDYLEVKAKSSIEETTKKVQKAKVAKDKEKPISTDSIKHPELFKSLKEWRNLEAEKLDKPSYFVAQLKTLIEIDEKLPATLAELKMIKGIGKQKISSYGQTIVDIINSYCNNNMIDRCTLNSHQQESIEVPIPQSGKHKAQDTYTVSLELFKEGNSIEEIAHKRQLAVTTINSHMARYIENGELDICQFIDGNKLNLIKDSFEKVGYEHLKPVKELLGDEITYGDIKLARAHFLRKNSN